MVQEVQMVAERWLDAVVVEPSVAKGPNAAAEDELAAAGGHDDMGDELVVAGHGVEDELAEEQASFLDQALSA